MKIVVINRDGMGSGSDGLGKILIGAFLRKLGLQPDKPNAIIFYNAGVLLLSEGSDLLQELMLLDEQGVDIIACGTCCDFFGITDKVRVGSIGDMQQIAGLLLKADNTVTI